MNEGRKEGMNVCMYASAVFACTFAFMSANNSVRLCVPTYVRIGVCM